ncbi:hypothetical protein ATCV1_z507R [Acanthocystis turfacea chlorella virus 1]|uniref:Uncharacterized protein z507R n=1 Tax=Chlorovirus heliozoae TaxID=322019 RepID=A7K9B7_9PHYC|nr:hypothetical protein ATCV1_z507R [Acanthocystis turfacea chlorella virus 1]ABT16641.1 hypothetical protein ATCV1_z507R [Acanthocystis turfacea chlorella virus 1]
MRSTLKFTANMDTFVNFVSAVLRVVDVSRTSAIVVADACLFVRDSVAMSTLLKFMVPAESASFAFTPKEYM